MRKSVKTMMIGVASAVLAGCVSAPMPPQDTRVTVAEDVRRDLYVTDVRCSKGNGEFYVFRANVVNNSRRTRLGIQGSVAGSGRYRDRLDRQRLAEGVRRGQGYSWHEGDGAAP